MSKPIGLASIDLMTTLLLVLWAMMAPPPVPVQASLETYGRFAITTSWPAGDDDVDLYVLAPTGEILFFANPAIADMYLEHDDLGRVNDHTELNAERAILRDVLQGEYVVNLHCYRGCLHPVTVTVTVYRLQGRDRALYSRRVTLDARGDEETVLRFRVSRSGGLRGVNRLPRSLVGARYG